MSKIVIGSARISENGTVTGKAGDQKNGAEVSTQDFYVHKKGWYVIRATESATAKKLASKMKAICANDNIGYSQDTRGQLLEAAKKVNYNISKITTKVNTDCSAAVRVCVMACGITVSDFNTESELSVLIKTGKFKKYTYTDGFELHTGDILVTKTKGHTAIVVSAPAATTTTTTSSSSDKKYKLTGNMNYRNGAGKSYNINGVIKKGTVVTITKVSNGWGYATGYGWISLQTEYTKEV